MNSLLEENRRLDPTEAQKLWDLDLLTLGAAADQVRRRFNPGNRVTFVIDRNINYTNICISGCRFCAFFRPPGAGDGYVLDWEALAAKLVELKDHGGSGVLLQGGLNPELSLAYYLELVSFIRGFGLAVHGFSPPEIFYMAENNALSLEELIRCLMDAGLSSIPGGGAEILVDRVRQQISPQKCSASQWLEVMAAAHRAGLKTSATMMFGHLETRAERVEHLVKIRELQDDTGGFTAFIPWTYQPGGTQLTGQALGAVEYLKTLAISRLVLDNVPHLQVSWVTQGPKVAQVALKFGADDFGSTMLEENVVAATGVGFRLTRAEIDTLIRQCGYEPQVRDHRYNLAVSSER
ncbi:MAG: cyclic dehypoxanthinyl futalosine synthase [Deltaproteobacteria bacterium]|nr:cyclic dehypoxanthinyl futalosine synthase [Deltaproteobacteria bacterium]